MNMNDTTIKHVAYQNGKNDPFWEYDAPIHSRGFMTDAVSPITAYTFDRKIKMTWDYACAKDSVTMTINDTFKVELVQDDGDGWHNDAQDIARRVVYGINDTIANHHSAIYLEQVMRVVMGISEEFDLGFREFERYDQEEQRPYWQICDKELAAKAHIGEDYVFFAFNLQAAHPDNMPTFTKDDIDRITFA